MSHKAILVVDDDKNICLLIKEYLEKSKKYFCFSVASAEQAMQILKNGNRIDLVLLDLNLPGIQGLEYLKELKQNSHTCKIPVLIISGEAKESEMGVCLKLGAADYIYKPIDFTVLGHRVEYAIASSDANKIKRMLEFRPDQVQAGYNILHHFKSILEKKYNDSGCSERGLKK